MKESTKSQTDFGFQKVDKDKKASLVHEVFASVAPQYDLMNDLMSFGLHRLWKDRMVGMLRVFEGAELLDIAGGTGDIAFRFLDKAKRQDVNVEVTVSDVNAAMLEEGKARAIDKNILQNISWRQADAEQLPFDNDAFDYCTIAFGIRNVTDISKALGEMYRVLRPGGRFLCLEFSHVDNAVLSKLYDQYSFNVIPKIGQVVTNDGDAYQYLVESIRQFPSREAFAGMMEEAGFAKVSSRPLNHGVVAIHSGWRM